MGKQIKDESSNNRITTKARYWTAVGYLENMRDDWQDAIGGLLQYPYEYCIHNKDRQGDGDDRKDHVHIVVAYGNTTTYKTALALFRKLNKEGCEAFNTCEPVANIKYIHDYLIHDTEDARKKGKYLYDKTERIAGNNFDIGAFEQISIADKKRMRKELGMLIFEQGFTNYLDFYMYVCNNFDLEYEDIVCTYSGHFSRLTKGNFQRRCREHFEKMQADRSDNKSAVVEEETEEEKIRKQVEETAKMWDEAGLKYCISNDGIEHHVCGKDISCFDCDERDDCRIFNPDYD